MKSNEYAQTVMNVRPWFTGYGKKYRGIYPDCYNGMVVIECDIDAVHRIEDHSSVIASPDVYLYDLTNIKAVRRGLSEFYEDVDCTRPLTKGPAHCQIVYKIEEEDDCGDDCFGYTKQKVVLFSASASKCANLLLGRQDFVFTKDKVEGMDIQ